MMNLSLLLLFSFRTKTFGLTTSQSNFLFLNGHPNHLKCCIHPWHRCHCTQVCKMSVTRMYTFCYSSNEQTVKVWAVASLVGLKSSKKVQFKEAALLFASKAKINVYFFKEAGAMLLLFHNCQLSSYSISYTIFPIFSPLYSSTSAN